MHPGGSGILPGDREERSIMGKHVRYVSGEPITVKDSKDLIHRIVEGPETCHRTATDAQGNSGTATAFDPQTAEDRAIFNLHKNRSK
jgi:hypothetical protein